MRHLRGRGEVHTALLWINLWERYHLEELGVDGRITRTWECVE